MTKTRQVCRRRRHFLTQKIYLKEFDFVDRRQTQMEMRKRTRVSSLGTLHVEDTSTIWRKKLNIRIQLSEFSFC
jgi:hypothetical protein